MGFVDRGGTGQQCPDIKRIHDVHYDVSKVHAMSTIFRFDLCRCAVILIVSCIYV